MIGTTKRLLLSLGCLLGLTLQGHSADQAAGREPEKRAQITAKQVVLEGKTINVDKIEYRLTGPFNHENLAVYLVHAKDEARADETYLTLDEGLRKRLVTVREKRGGGDVQELIIENKSDYPLYLQEGDRLSGGQQDRTVQTPLVIKPKSGPQKLPTFCIEQGRWQASNPQNAFAASISGASAPKSVRAAAKFESDQSVVWSNVNKTKVEFAASLRSGNTNSSLNESLDSQFARDAAAGYTKPLGKLLEGQKDVVGVAFAVDGQIEEVNIYAGHPLMAKMYPRLLESYAMEAAVAKNKPAQAQGKAAEQQGGNGKIVAKPDGRNDRVAENLKKPLNTKYNGMEFADVLDDLRAVADVDFVIDWSAIEEAGIKRDKRIVVRVRTTPGDEVLRQVLQFAGGKEADTLAYTIADGKVHISQRSAITALAGAEAKRLNNYVTPSPEALLATAPRLDAIAAFMSHGPAAPKTNDRQIDAANKLQVMELSDRFFARSIVGNTVIHRQWMRAEKEPVVKE